MKNEKFDEIVEQFKDLSKEYRKNPVTIRAMKLSEPMTIETLEGDMLGNTGDWLIQGVEGEFYPCKDSVFRKTYSSQDATLNDFYISNKDAPEPILRDYFLTAKQVERREFVKKHFTAITQAWQSDPNPTHWPESMRVEICIREWQELDKQLTEIEEKEK